MNAQQDPLDDETELDDDVELPTVILESKGKCTEICICCNHLFLCSHLLCYP